MHTNENPWLADQGFSRSYGELCQTGAVDLLSIQPFTNIVGYYTCYYGEYKRNKIGHNFTSSLLEVHSLYKIAYISEIWYSLVVSVSLIRRGLVYGTEKQ